MGEELRVKSDEKQKSPHFINCQFEDEEEAYGNLYTVSHYKVWAWEIWHRISHQIMDGWENGKETSSFSKYRIMEGYLRRVT